MFVISKEFDFDYGHRVWSQELQENLSLTTHCKCRHPHGHRGKVIVYLKSPILENGMVTDFNHLNFFKKFLDDVIDHKTILDMNDPLFKMILPDVKSKPLIGERRSSSDFTYYEEGCWLINKPRRISSHEWEWYGGFVIVDFVPTSENLSKWLFDILNFKFRDKINQFQVERIEFYETPKSKSTYIGK